MGSTRLKAMYGVWRLAARAPGKRPRLEYQFLIMLIGCRAQSDAQACQAKYAGGPVLV